MKKRILAGALSLCLFASALPGAHAASFTDVPERHWSYEFVEKAHANELVSGTGDGAFQPDNTVSNAEWATMVCNLFYADSIEAYHAQGGNTEYWWMPYMYVGQRVLGGTTVMNDGWRSPGWEPAVVTAGISRYDMAQVIYNIALHWEQPSTTGIESHIADWSSVPENYRDAVAYCFAAGFVTGVDANGTFDGNNTMTRGAAAVVLCRLLDAKNGTHQFEMSGSSSPSDGSSTGEPTLANGKAVTEENIWEILAEYQERYPTGTTWGQERTYTSPTFGYGAACDAWAYMISDALWGDASYTTHTDLNQVKAGDIVYLYNQETRSGHWLVVTGIGSDSEGFSYFISCDGNNGGKVMWDSRNYVQHTTNMYPDFTIYSFYT